MNLGKKFTEVLREHGWKRRRHNLWLHPTLRGKRGTSNPLFTEQEAVAITVNSQNLGKK